LIATICPCLLLLLLMQASSEKRTGDFSIIVHDDNATAAHSRT
jgi:hypothetical protein